MESKQNGVFSSLVFLSLALTLVTVVLSAYIRLASNGLGCEPWPACYGQIGPRESYSPSASFTDANPEKPYGTARAFHRCAASLLGLFVLLLLIQAWRGRASGNGKLGATLLFVITVFLSILGYSTPSPWIPAVTLGNLLGGMSMLAILWWMMQKAVPRTRHDNIESFRPLALTGLVVLFMQIALGAWTSGHYAAPACGEFPSCAVDKAPLGEAFNPARQLQVDAGGRIVPEPAMATVQQTHRYAALLTLALLTVVGLRARKAGGALHASGTLIVAMAWAQFLLAIASVWLAFPLIMVTLHNAGAAVLVMGMTNLLYHASHETA